VHSWVILLLFDKPVLIVVLLTCLQPGMTEEECKAFVVKAVAHAMARDGSSGGCIRTVVISKDGVKRSFLAGDAVPVAAGELPPPVRPVQA
jgi:20S proteasome subunit beta 1